MLLSWIAGITLMGYHFSFAARTWWLWLILAIVIFCTGLYKGYSYQQSIWHKLLLLVISSWALFCTGFYYADSALEQRLSLREVEAQPFEAIVYIKKIDELTEEGPKQTAEVLNRHAQPVDWLLYLNQSNDQFTQQHLRLGHYYRLHGTIKPAHSYAVAGAFDQEKWFLQQNIMSAYRVRHIQLLSQDEIDRLGYQPHLKQQHRLQAKFLLNVEIMRLSFREMLQASAFQHKGLLLALLTGDESLLSNRLKQQFQQLGISHLLAISGPHVLIFALMLTWLLKCMIQRYAPTLYLWQPRQILLLLPFGLSVLLYVAFVGFEIPALRTLFTVIIGSLFLLFRQSIQPLILLIYSASLLLIYDPFSILSAAFWLSYGACFILLRIYQSIEQGPPQNQVLTKTQQYVWALKILIESQWKVFIALLPLVLIFFQQIAWFAPLSNLIAIPLLSTLIVPLDIIAACIWLVVPAFGQLLFQLNDGLLSILMWILNHVQQLSPQLYAVSYTPLMLLSLTLGLVILFMPTGTIPKIWGAICILPIFGGIKAQPMILNVLDVGQGQAIFLQHPQQTLMIDTGGSYDETRFGMGERVIIPFLRQHGVRKLDHVVLSHLDQDHSGAFAAIQKAFAITQVQSNERDQKMPFKNNFSLCQQGQTWSYSNLKIAILSPDREGLSFAKYQQNEQSCVVYLQFFNAQPYQNFLIMGDAGWETEYKLLKQYPDLKVDVLVLGHHGSKHSSTYDFLATLKPKLAIASAGFENHYGHPSRELQSRLDALKIPLLNTAQTGSLSFIFGSETVELKQQRQQRKWLQRE